MYKNEFNKKGFTLIELIVVIVVLAILVLLAAPRLTGFTSKAHETQIINDIKVVENKVAEMVINDKDELDSWNNTPNPKSRFEELVKDKRLYDKRGLLKSADQIDGVHHKDIPHEYIKKEIKSSLEGDFFVSEKGGVLYSHNKSIGKKDNEDQDNNKDLNSKKIVKGDAEENPTSYTDDEGNEFIYYGEVSVVDLIPGDVLSERMRLNSGTNINSNEGWLKFRLKGQSEEDILYVAKKPYKYGLFWSSIYSAGITGDVAQKPYANYNWYNNIRQNESLNIGDNRYRVRLLTNEEWEKLIVPVVSENERPLSNGKNLFKAGKDGKGFSEEEIGINKEVTEYGARNYLQDKDPNGTSSDVIVRGTEGVNHTAINSVGAISTSLVGWRPVLEYIGPRVDIVHPYIYADERIIDNDLYTHISRGEMSEVLIGLDEKLQGKKIAIDSNSVYYDGSGVLGSVTRYNTAEFLDKDDNVISSHKNIGGRGNNVRAEGDTVDVLDVPDGAVAMKFILNRYESWRGTQYNTRINDVWVHDEIDEVPIPFEYEYPNNNELYIGHSYIAQEGVDGLITSNYEINIEDNGKLNRELISNSVDEPTKHIVSVGVKPYPKVEGTPFYGPEELFDNNIETNYSNGRKHLDKIIIKLDENIDGKSIRIHSNGVYYDGAGVLGSTTRFNTVEFINSSGNVIDKNSRLGGYSKEDAQKSFESDLTIPEGTTELHFTLNTYESWNGTRYNTTINEISLIKN